MSRATLIAALHDAPLQVVLTVTGGGATAVADLLGVPGGSRIVLAAHVPYCEGAWLNDSAHVPSKRVRNEPRGCWPSRHGWKPGVRPSLRVIRKRSVSPARRAWRPIVRNAAHTEYIWPCKRQRRRVRGRWS
ncbi:MAG: hypothetical protein QM811_21675 [Pirellulales bacterium]